MWTRALVFLLGAVFIYRQAFAVDAGVYIAELMIESNRSLNTSAVLAVLRPGVELTNVTIVQSELTAECVLIGDFSTCHCSAEYIWSNDVCYQQGCCNESSCKINASDYTPLCIPKVKVGVNGSVKLGVTWDDASHDKLLYMFQALNGFEDLNVTVREDDTMVDFEARLSVVFPTDRLQANVTALEHSLGATIHVDTTGIVDIEAPEGSVCYRSQQTLRCTLGEWTNTSGWSLSSRNGHFELNNGSVVTLNASCAPPGRSCTEITLKDVTGNWAGTYECGFTSGPIRHTAAVTLIVALLPDDITMTFTPLAVACPPGASEAPRVRVTAVIASSTENYTVTWHYQQTLLSTSRQPSSSEGLLSYAQDVSPACNEARAQNVSVTFMNSMGATKRGEVLIPVVYASGKNPCESSFEDGVLWPLTPNGATLFSPTCDPGRVGHKERTCRDGQWDKVFSRCVDEKLDKVLDAADNFLQGMGATQEVAEAIFEGLKNSSSSVSQDSGNTAADLDASVGVLVTMAKASENILLEEPLIPDLLDAASNMLNKSWDGFNSSNEAKLASNYLRSVEGLVKNINIKTSGGSQTQNVDLKICRSQRNSEDRKKSECKSIVFGIGVQLNTTSGIVKTMAVKNLAEKLDNIAFHTVGAPRLLVSATLEQGDPADTDVNILLDFPLSREPHTHGDVLCVFWNFTTEEWSRDGCEWIADDVGNRTLCRCNHLTSFSALFSKSASSKLPYMEEITYVGLGVSILSLLLFLAVEALVWSAVVLTHLAHFRHTALVNISICLLLADCSVLASNAREMLGRTGCLVVAVGQHFFLLATFGWMLSLSVTLVHQLVFVFQPLRKRVVMFFSSILGYVCPTVIVGCSYVYCKYVGEEYHDNDRCWLIYKGLLRGSLYAFLLPVGAVILVNLFCMGVVICMVAWSTKSTDMEAGDKSTAKSILKVVLLLTPVFGVTWMLGFLLLLLDNANEPLRTVVSYAFTILNSFQGFFIFLTCCFAEQKVREEMLKLIMARTLKGGSENPTSTSNTKHR